MKTEYGEFKVMTVRETVKDYLAETPQKIATFLRENVPASSWFDPDKEAFIAILLNTRTRIIGFNLVSLGILDQCIVHPREVFRPAIVAAANRIVLAHNHPSGETTPSDADIKMTQNLIRAGQLLKIEVIDHVIWSAQNESYKSLREMGYFYS